MKNQILTALKNYENIELFSDEWREWLNDDSYVIMFKVNNHNVYRLILFSDCMCFQCIAYAFYVNGDECYDDAIDYKSVHTTDNYNEWLKYRPGFVDDDMLVDDDTSKWADYVVQFIDECETECPEYTEYE